VPLLLRSHQIGILGKSKALLWDQVNAKKNAPTLALGKLFSDHRFKNCKLMSSGPRAFAFRLLLMIDIGLLLFRAAGFLLGFTFGVQKIGWYVTAFHAGKSLSSIGLTPLIAHMGFPLPIILALWITLNEWIGAFFVGIGLLTRFAAASLALGMIGALYTSVRLGEDWLRAALYFIIFLGLIFTGAGNFSIDRLLQTRKTKH
jgi:uncharacterized membrane protein YphA (DoxX/SURF4 family)